LNETKKQANVAHCKVLQEYFPGHSEKCHNKIKSGKLAPTLITMQDVKTFLYIWFQNI
jgi:hypothetical protein